MTTKTAAIKLPKILDGAASINSAIAKIQSSGKRFDDAVQIAALSVLNHASLHGDTTLADALAKALPAGSRLRSLVTFMTAHGQIRLLSKADPADAAAIKAGRVFSLDRTKPAFNLETAALSRWTDAIKAETVESLLDAPKLVASLTSRLGKAIQEGKVEHVDGALVEARKLVAMLETARAA